jgi:hypothetical protein
MDIAPVVLWGWGCGGGGVGGVSAGGGEQHTTAATTSPATNRENYRTTRPALSDDNPTRLWCYYQHQVLLRTRSMAMGYGGRRAHDEGMR